MVQTIKPTNYENKPSKLTKATWVQSTLYTEKHHQIYKQYQSFKTIHEL